jgi:hypothetical protein
VFIVELLLSPVLAGVALLVPVVEQWGSYGYIPAIVWLALFVQGLFTFRWRGLWFLLGPPVAFLIIEAFLVAAPPAARAPTAVSPGEHPLIVHNPDGTIAAQTEPPRGKSGNAKEKGLLIPPQVVVPTVRKPANGPENQAH